MDAGKVTGPLLRMFPNRTDVNRTGSIDPEVMVAVDWLVLAICGWSTARVCRWDKRGMTRDSR